MAEGIGFPVVLKISSPDIIFRQDVGGVVPGITTRRGSGGNTAACGEGPGPPPRGGHPRGDDSEDDGGDRLRIDPGGEKGPGLWCGDSLWHGGGGGGVFRDFAIGLPPLNQALARRLMEDTKVYGMLQGYRGKTPADLRQLEEILVSFSNLIMDFPEILAMDMNPIAVSDGKAVALDARILLDREALNQDVPYPHLVISPYPARYISAWRLRDGTEVLLRPVKPEDEPLEHAMFTSLSEATLRERFYQSIRTITHEMHVRLCNIDYDREMTIVAEIREGGARRMIGMGSFVIEPDGRSCEFSVLVHDDAQGQGLASKLLDILIGIADERGLETFFGYIEPSNRRMLNLSAKLGMRPEKTPHDLVRMSLRLR